MKLLRSSTPWLISLVCGVGLVAAVGYGQRVAQNKPAATPAAATVTELSSIFRNVSKQVLPAVVSLRVKQKDPAEGGREDVEKFFEQNPDLPERFRDFYRRRRGGPGGSPPGGSQGMGSGSIIDAKGIILTNYHVIKDAQEVVVRLHDGREIVATEFMGDPRTDVAIVKIEGAGPLTALKLGDSDPVQVGDWVLAFGSPFGLDLSVTAGIISAKGRGPGIAEREDFLQTDAAINPGNSGGPLVDMNGRMIGMNTAIATNSRSSAGVGFAVPVNMVRWVSNQLIKDGKVKRAWLGVAVRPIDAQLARQFKIKIGAGAIIGEVMQNSPAAKSGLLPQDIIQHFDGKAIDGPRKLQSIVERLEVGKTYPVKIRRGGKNQTVKVTVAQMPASDKIRPRE
jgi:serine protease Do